MNLKEQYRRFRTWQKGPHQHSMKGMEVEHTCANCGYVFMGNYCPVCGQNGHDSRITWHSIWRSIMMLWGMDSHSMPYSLFQLLLRPGYFISEYISGRRQISYPPVKMLFIMAVIYSVAKQLLGIEVESTDINNNQKILDIITAWMKSNPGWAMMTLTMLLTLPTWFIFRFAPRHTKHTIPEGAFVQLFMSTIMLSIAFVENVIYGGLVTLVPIYYYITYRQLFGYSRWGTVWRLLLCFAVWLWAIVLGTSIAFTFYKASFGYDENSERIAFLGIALISLIAIAIHIAIGYWISKRTYNKRAN